MLIFFVGRGNLECPRNDEIPLRVDKGFADALEPIGDGNQDITRLRNT